MLLVDELREAWTTEPRDHRVALSAICIVAIVLRLWHLAQPMRYDEAVTYMYFVRRSWADALSLYTYPNNHLFHTLLAKVVVGIVGNEPWALRLPALVAGILVVPATYAVTRALYDARAALFSAAIVATSGTLVLYSTNARGYTLVVLAFLLMLLAGARILKGAPPSTWISYAIVGALGLWTIPVMLFPIGAASVWIALCLLVAGRGAELPRLGWSLALAAGLAMLAYAPVVAHEGLSAVTRNQFVTAMGWYDFFEQLPGTIAAALVSWSLGVPALVYLALAVCAVVALRFHARVARHPVNIALGAFVWSSWLLVVTHRAPFPRVWLWMLPVASGLAGAGAGVLLGSRPRGAQLLQRRAPAIAVGFAAAAALSVGVSRAVFNSVDTGTYRDAAAAAHALGPVLRPGDRVVAPIPSNAPLSYYFDRDGISQQYLYTAREQASRVVVVVNRAEGHSLGRILPRAAGDTTPLDTTVIARFPDSDLVLLERHRGPPR